jgi:hypothetical protein
VGQAERNAGFAVPSSLEAQETGFLVAGQMLGLASDAALPLSLAKRLRELAIGLPALVAWQWLEKAYRIVDSA